MTLVFGHVAGFPPGSTFASRGKLKASGLHFLRVATPRGSRVLGLHGRDSEALDPYTEES